MPEIKIPTLVLTMINFLVFFAILRAILYRPLMAMLDRRREEIASGLAKAAEAEKRAEELRRDFDAQVASARREAQDIVNKALSEVEEVRAKRMAEIEEEASRRLEKAREAISLEKERAVAALREEVATLAVLAAGKVLERSITTEDHKRLVDEFVDGVGGIKC